MTKIIITGSKGRMGQALLSCAANIPDLEVVGTIDQGDDLGAVIGKADAVIDFSFHTATLGVAKLCAQHKKAIVIGTTGHKPEEKAEIVALKSQIPMVMATNYSTGVNTLFWLTRKAAEILGPAFDLEVVEMHHRLKKDAPSGTATTLLEILGDVRKLQLEEALRHGRKGITGERTPGEIGIHAIRGGDVVGDHTVIFANNGERVELTHKASSRDTFANGALRASQWVVKQKPGLYDMQDVLGLK
ncbi:MAG TPA: 4-hydroxy-tetrahydrodipicolinate reductase [Candidatus Paceibacterota bacterium]|nr:4-hydroxy-tetrahydrodipicolinate reductase [Candidatus Paceibacterota bacterium]